MAVFSLSELQLADTSLATTQVDSTFSPTNSTKSVKILKFAHYISNNKHVYHLILSLLVALSALAPLLSPPPSQTISNNYYY